MNGAEIVGSIVINTLEDGKGLHILHLVLAIMALLAIAYVIIFKIKSKKANMDEGLFYFCIFLPIVMSIFIVGLGRAAHIKLNTPEYIQYEVVIDETCSMVEFNEKYKIIEHNDGSRYYVVTEKNNEQ